MRTRTSYANVRWVNVHSCIFSAGLFRSVLDVRVKRSPELSTDHHLVVCNVRLEKPKGPCSASCRNAADSGAVTCRGQVMPGATSWLYAPLPNSCIEQWRMVVIVTSYTLFVTSQYEVIFTFAKQRFGEVCWHCTHIILPTRTLLTRCCTMCHCNEHKLYQRSKLGDRRKAQHSTLKQSSSQLQKYPITRWNRGVEHTQCYVSAVHNCKNIRLQSNSNHSLRNSKSSDQIRSLS